MAMIIPEPMGRVRKEASVKIKNYDKDDQQMGKRECIL